MRFVRTTKVLIATLLVAAGTVRAEKLTVTFNREGANGKPVRHPPWDFAGFGIKRADYSKSTLDASFAENLKRAKLFILGPWSSQESEKALFPNKKYTAAITEFFKNGGTMFCMHIGEPYAYGASGAYFKSIGVTLPPTPTGRDAGIAVAPGSGAYGIMTKPNALAKEGGGGKAYGRWSKWPAEFKPLFVSRADRKQAATLIREKILGRGTLILTRINLHQQSKVKGVRLYSALVENTFTHAFGRLEKGATVTAEEHGELGAAPPHRAASTSGRRPANKLFLRGLLEKPWWDQAWQHRVPVLVSEPSGLRRYQAPVSVVHDFPRGTQPASIRVVTPWGEELPSQASVVDAAKNRIEVVFVQDLAPHEDRPVFVYFGNSAAAAPTYESDTKLTRTDAYFRIATPNILASFRTDTPIAVQLQPAGNPTGNQLARNYRRTGGVRSIEDGHANGFPWAQRVSDVTVRVKEDGPVRKVLEYKGTCKGKPVTVTYAIYATGRRVEYAIRSGTPLDISQRSTCWLPGRGIEVADTLYFESASGVRKLRISNSGEYHSILVENLVPDIKEGWYAIHDTETGQTVGEVFELADTSLLRCHIHAGLGLRMLSNIRLTPASYRGAFVPGRGGFSAVRNEYVEWKTPPVVHTARVQRRAEVGPPRVPVFGKNMLRYLQTSSDVPPRNSLEGYLLDTQRLGANFVAIWPYKPIWPTEGMSGSSTGLLQRILHAAHARGIGVEVALNGCGKASFWPKPPSKYLDKIKHRDWFVRAAAEVSRFDIDVLHLQDESGYGLGGDAARELFRKKYGMEPAKNVTVKNLSEPACYNRAFFEMDVYTDCLRDMYNAARKHNKRAVIADQININHMVNIKGGYNDMESHVSFLDAKCMDLYHDANEDFKFWIKYLCGVRQNRLPILMYSGYCTSQRKTEQNQKYLLMWGADALATWYRGVIWPSIHETVRRNLCHLDYTGLGDMLVQSTPVKSIAVLRDRAAFIDGVKKGEWQTAGSTYEIRLRKLVKVKNLQTDIVFSRYFTPKTLRQYGLLVVANNPVLSDKHAQTIRSYVEAGGRLIIEGEGINNPIMQKLCGAVPKGAPAEKRGRVRAKGGSFAFFGSVVPADISAQVIARFEDKTPAFVSAKVGKGEVIYTPLIMSDKMVQEDLIAFYRALARRLLGKFPVEVAAAHINAVDTNLTGDGQRHILALANLGYKDRAVGVKLNVPVPAGSVVVDMTTGEQRRFAANMAFDAPRGSIRFHYIGPRAGIARPAAVEIAMAGRDIAYCARPATQPLKLAVATEGGGRGKKRKKEPGFAYIGVLTDKDVKGAPKQARVRGDEGIHDALQGKAGLKVEYIRDLAPTTIAFYDAVVIPNIGWSSLPSVMASGWEQTIREYVENGGAVLLNHHATGFKPPCDHSPFPEIAKAGAWVKLQDMIVRKTHSVTSGESMRTRFPTMAKDPAFKAQMAATLMVPGTRFRAGFPDYVILVPGSAGAALVESEKATSGEGGDAVVVAGKVGKGKVVLSGMAIGSKGSEEGVSAGGEANILLNAAYWLTER